jgi:phosphoadenosine phosphosulfate reductase
VLIPSPRHRPADLELWSDLEEADQTLARMPRIEWLADRSIDEIKSFVPRGPCYCSVSWGKDSVALAHLVVRSGVAMPLVHVHAAPVANPESHAVRDAFLGRYPCDYHEITIDYRATYGITDLEERGLAGDRVFFAAFRRFGPRYLSGIRSDESGGRKIRMRRWGLTSENACAPLGWWRGHEVFAYLALHDLPVHPSYAMLGAGRWERKHIRVDELAGRRGTQFGRAEWEAEYYGDFLRRLAAGK